MQALVWIKLAHVCFALLSGAGFALRGLWMMRGSARLQAPWVRVAPHLLDTLLLASGVTLALMLRISPLAHPWLAAKLGLLLLYVGAGTVAIRRGRTRGARTLALGLALAVYALIVATALTHRPLGLG